MAYISTKEVSAIRNELKEKFGKNGFKFSVRASDKMKVHVNIMKGKTDFSDLWKNNKPGDYGFGYEQINHYHLHQYGKHENFFREIEKVIQTAPASVTGEKWYDKSDIQSDYFNVAFYYQISVGQWDKPYVKE
jgi:hypothetical protein